MTLFLEVWIIVFTRRSWISYNVNIFWINFRFNDMTGNVKTINICWFIGAKDFTTIAVSLSVTQKKKWAENSDKILQRCSVAYWFSGNCVNKKVMQVTTPSIEVIELLAKLSLNLFSSLSGSWLSFQHVKNLKPSSWHSERERESERKVSMNTKPMLLND